MTKRTLRGSDKADKLWQFKSRLCILLLFSFFESKSWTQNNSCQVEEEDREKSSYNMFMDRSKLDWLDVK